MAQKQYPLQVQKYGHFCQVTLTIQKISISSNQILNLGSMKTVHAVCKGYILQTQDLLNYNLQDLLNYKLTIIYFNIQILFQSKQIFVNLCVYGYICVYIIMYLYQYRRVYACMCVHAYAYVRLCVRINMCAFVCYFF